MDRYYSLFENVAISLWEEDFSAVKKYIDHLRNQGIVNFRDYFEQNPHEVMNCVEMVRIVGVNKATLDLYQASSKDELLKGLQQIFIEDTYKIFGEELIALIGGEARFESEAWTQTLKGDPKYIHLTLFIAPGYEYSWSRVFLSIVDMTNQKLMEESLKSGREYFMKLNDSLDQVIFTIKIPERLIVYVNRSVRNTFGYDVEECVGKSTDFLYPTKKAHQDFGKILKNTLKKGKDSLTIDVMLKRKNGEIFPAEIVVTFLKSNNKVTEVISVLRDITERKGMEETLRKSEAMLKEAERIGHIGNWDWNIATNNLLWSDEIYRIFGLSPEQFSATYEAFLNTVHPEDRDLVERSVNEALHKGKSYDIEHRIVRPDGTVRTVHEVAEVSFNTRNKPIRMFGVVHDISGHKLVEGELRALSTELVRLQEEERGEIARELHDQIGQYLTVLSILLDKAKREPSEEVSSTLNKAKEITSELIREVRDLSLDLRPAMLDTLGLLQTLLWHFDHIYIQAQLQVNFHHAGLQWQFPSEIRLAAYRIVQEALNNVMRYAEVSEVTVKAYVDDHVLRLSIEDKGIGFDPNVLSLKQSSGLYGMRERALALGGTLTVDSTEGVGTVVSAEIPL
jgi:PAS domain S-box-containing protein